MAQDSAFQINTCIVCKASLVSFSPPPLQKFVFYPPVQSFEFFPPVHASPTFELLGSVWCLQFSKKTGSHRLELNQCGSFQSAYVPDACTVSLVPMKSEGEVDTLKTPFSVGTCMRHPTDVSRAPVCWQWHDVTKREQVDIWSLSCSDIATKMDWVSQLREVRFVCLFYGAGTELGNLDERNDRRSSEVPRDLESLSSDFSHLLEKEILPDVKLECGGRTLQAHRSVLAARSLVFKAMFQNEMLESETGAVKIPDVDVGVLQKLLRYVYTGKPGDISESTAADLYEAADKYDVRSLKTACAYWIERNLTVENCVKYLVVADSHSDPDLKAAVVKFILENPSLMKSQAWITFSKELPLLANEVLLAYVASAVQ